MSVGAWFINGVKTDSLKIEDIKLDYRSFEADTAEITAHPDYAPAFGTELAISWSDGGEEGQVVLFRGIVWTLRATNEGGRKHNVMQVLGPWKQLEAVQFKQQWAVTAEGELVSALSGRLILNQNAAGAPQTAGAQMTEAVAFAAAAGVPVAVGTITAAVQLPFDETRDLTVAQVLVRTQRFLPDLVSWFNYAVDPPALNISVPSSGFSTAYIDKLSEVTSVRNDLAADGVELEIERVDSINGAQIRRLEIQSAGDTESLRCIRATLNPAGGSFSESVRVIDVVTEAVPASLSDAAWWIARHPRLRGRSAADIAFVESGTRSGTHSPLFPRITLAPLSDLSALNLGSEMETFRCVVDITVVDGGGAVDIERGVELTMEYVTTDAQTQTYRYVEGYDSEAAEVVPSDLATKLLAHWSTVFEEGIAVMPQSSFFGYNGFQIGVGWYLDLPSRPIQSRSLSAMSGLVTLTFGPPRQLGVQDMADRLLPFRAIRSSSRWRARVDGKPPASKESKTSVLSPSKYDSSTPGKKEIITIVKASGGSISADAREVETGATIKPQPVLFTEASSPQQIMAAQPTQKVRVIGMRDTTIQELDVEVLAYEIPETDTLTEEIDVVTDVTYDATAHKFVKTLKKVRVIKGTYTGGDGDVDIVSLVAHSGS